MSRLPVSVPSVVRAITVVENGRSGVAWSSFLVRLKVTLHSARRGWQASPGFVGDHMQGVTPVPIPNTEVKLLQPMILLSGKVGYRRLYGPRQVKLGEALFVFALSFRRHWLILARRGFPTGRRIRRSSAPCHGVPHGGESRWQGVPAGDCRNPLCVACV